MVVVLVPIGYPLVTLPRKPALAISRRRRSLPKHTQRVESGSFLALDQLSLANGLRGNRRRHRDNPTRGTEKGSRKTLAISRLLNLGRRGTNSRKFHSPTYD